MKNQWNRKRLGDLNISYFKGIAPKDKDPKGDVILVPSGAVFPTGVDFERTKRFCSSNVNINDKILRDGDVLFNCGGVGTLGRSSYFKYPSIGNMAVPDSFVLAIRSRNTDALSSRFLFHFLQTDQIKNQIIANTRGTTGITSIRTEAILGFQIPLPDLTEQRRIVRLLDDAFKRVARATANTTQNLRKARDIYDSVLEESFVISANVGTVELKELIHTLTDYHANGSYKVLKEHVELKDSEDFAWMVRSTDFENNFQNEMRYITKPAYEFLKKSRLFGGEIIMSKIGNAGRVYLMPQIDRPCSLAMNLFLIRLNENRVRNTYVYRFLKSRQGRAQIQARLKGTATLTITKESVRNLEVPLPSKMVQDRIVSRLENIEYEVLRLESIYRQKLAALDELRKSVLHQAFNGDL